MNTLAFIFIFLIIVQTESLVNGFKQCGNQTCSDFDECCGPKMDECCTKIETILSKLNFSNVNIVP